MFLEKIFCGFVQDNIRLKPNLSLYPGVPYYWQNYFHDDPNNFAPRVGFAYAPTANSKTVIRRGAGVFYDRTRLFLKPMLPQVRDVTDLVQAFSYNLGLTKVESRFSKLNYAEKVEYWAFMSGTVVMTVSGFLLWFNDFTLRHFPSGFPTRLPLLHFTKRCLRPSPSSCGTSTW